MSSPRLVAKLKVMLLGDSGVGKTYWMKKVINGDNPGVPTRRNSSSALEMAISKVDSADYQYEFAFFNPNPNEKFKAVVDFHLKTPMDAYVIFYNINAPQSFENVDVHFARARSKSTDAKVLLLGLHFGGESSVTQEQAEAKAKKFGMRSYYGVNAKIDSAADVLMQPLNYIARNSNAIQFTVPSLDFRFCIKEINRALRFSSDPERARILTEFKQQLDDFSCYGEQVTLDGLKDMQQECSNIVTKAQTILDGAFPERIKMAVFGVSALVLLTAAAVCGLALLNVITLPLLTGVLIAGCVMAGAGGLASAGCFIFKARENIIYSSIVDTAQKAVREFPGLR